ncbi:hypothetical protein BJ986_002292 [Phycicoccus badiiscoriae]|uniref:Uncharacterized protein n=1 Tax=Pedococcus badiiscoriae TaxID=642776 RepID=A0A852WNJ9_9MICO|nr:hypothetical protein [Pedococcus badiiscoriae]NYG07805.1 hypothetical protein [Pedococcus badiiscoriae]
MDLRSHAAELGYANRGTVFRIVSNALEARETDAIEELRLLERERLDALQAPLWDAAMTGDVSAANAILRIIQARVRLLGLAEGPRSELAAPRTVVVSCLPIGTDASL